MMWQSAGWRKRLVADLTGDVLEIGVGEGENLAHYAKARQVWAIEPDATRAEAARAVAGKLTIPITIDTAGAEALPYRDHSFDHVVSSLVFCSVNDQTQALREVRRVLRPGGVLHMVEHVQPETKWLAAFFHALTPWWQGVAHNCHLDRPTLNTLEQLGWQVTVHRRRAMFVRLSAR